MRLAAAVLLVVLAVAGIAACAPVSGHPAYLHPAYFCPQGQIVVPQGQSWGCAS